MGEGPEIFVRGHGQRVRKKAQSAPDDKLHAALPERGRFVERKHHSEHRVRRSGRVGVAQTQLAVFDHARLLASKFQLVPPGSDV